MTKNKRFSIALLSLLAIALLAGGAFISYRVGFSQGYIAAAEAGGEDGFAALQFGFDRFGGEFERGEGFESPFDRDGFDRDGFGRGGLVRGFGRGPFLLFPIIGLVFVLFVVGAVVVTVLLLRRRKNTATTTE